MAQGLGQRPGDQHRAGKRRSGQELGAGDRDQPAFPDVGLHRRGRKAHLGCVHQHDHLVRPSRGQPLGHGGCRSDEARLGNVGDHQQHAPSSAGCVRRQPLHLQVDRPRIARPAIRGARRDTDHVGREGAGDRPFIVDQVLERGHGAIASTSQRRGHAAARLSLLGDDRQGRPDRIAPDQLSRKHVQIGA